LVVLVCLLPLALYCLFLAWLNGSKRAWLIRGTWDFAWVLFALSGFLLAGGPAILTGFNEYWRTFWLGRFEGRPWSQVLAANRTLGYLLLGAGYLLLVFCIAARTLWRRRLMTVIYNVDAAAFESTLFQTMEGMGLRWIRSGNLICWSRAGTSPDAETEWDDGAVDRSDTSIQTSPASPGGEQARQVAPLTRPQLRRAEEEITQTLQLEVSPALCYVCLQWRTADGWPRQAVEGELDRYREQLCARDNPVGFWLLLASTLFVFGLFLGMAAFLVLALLGR
jgi:hypothetical protein